MPPAVFSAARFASRCPQNLEASFQRAKSSQRFRAAACLRRSFLRRDLLPAARKALRLRSGEQNLHRNSAPLLASGRVSGGLFCGSCWRRPAGNPLCHRRGTPTGRPKCRLPANHVGAAPPAKPYATAGPRQQGAPKTACRLTMLAPPRRQTLNPPSGHANRAPRITPAGRLCWRRPDGKAIYHRRATPTSRPKNRLPANHVGAAPPAKPYATAGPRQQGALNPARRPTLLAPPRRQSHMPPSGHANRAPKNSPAGRPCWRRPADKAIYHRRATPTGRPESRLPADYVGAVPTAKPYATAGPRQQGAQSVRAEKKTADTYLLQSIQ